MLLPGRCESEVRTLALLTDLKGNLKKMKT
jgi:hypothetical protein